MKVEDPANNPPPPNNGGYLWDGINLGCRTAMAALAIESSSRADTHTHHCKSAYRHGTEPSLFAHSELRGHGSRIRPVSRKQLTRIVIIILCIVIEARTDRGAGVPAVAPSQDALRRRGAALRGPDAAGESHCCGTPSTATVENRVGHGTGIGFWIRFRIGHEGCPTSAGRVLPQVPIQQQDQEGQAALPAQVRQRSAEEERRNVGHDAGCDCAGGAAAPRTGIPRRRPRTHAHHFWPGNGTVIHITGSIVSAGEYTYTGVPESRKTHH